MLCRYGLRLFRGAMARLQSKGMRYLATWAEHTLSRNMLDNCLWNAKFEGEQVRLISTQLQSL